MKNIMQGRHSKLPPSRAARRMVCPGSRALEEKYPSKETPASREGEAAHWLATLIARDNLNLSYPETAPNGEPITQEMIDGAKLYAKTIWELKERALKRKIAFHSDNNFFEFFEIPLDLSDIHPECFGTPDYWFFLGGELHIVDYKFGHSYMDVFENYQLLEYAIGASSYVKKHGGEIEHINLMIVQPRFYGNTVRSWQLSPNQLATYHVDIATKEALSMSADESSKYYKVSAHCKNCSAAHACAKLKDTAAQTLEAIQQFTPTYSYNAELSNEDLGKEISMLKKFEKIIEARLTGLEEQAKHLIQKGEDVSGFKLESGAGREKWTLSDQDIIKLGYLFQVNLAKPLQAITPAQALKAGLPEMLKNKFSERTPGALKLVEIDQKKVKRIFSHE